MTTTVFLVDDHEIVRRGIRDLLEADPDIEVVGEAGTVAQALDRVPPADPDVAILDVRLPDGTGVEVCRTLLSTQPKLRCLMLTSFADDEALMASILAGASGYVVKEVRGLDILGAVRRVAAGESLVDRASAERVAERLSRGPELDERLQDLTPQEHKILGLIVEGKTNRQIGRDLFLAEKTVKNYVSNVLAKMGMASRTEAAVYAVRLAERERPRY